MSFLLGRRPSPAMVIALIALFVSLGGVSYGVATGSIDSRELKNNAVRSTDIRDNNVSSRDIRDASLLAKDFRSGELPAGPAGPAGPKGDKGDKGDTGAAGATGETGPPGPTASARAAGGPVELTDFDTVVATTNITLGFSGRIMATASLMLEGDGGDDDIARCELRVTPPGSSITGVHRLGIPATGDNRAVMALAGATDVVGPGTYAVNLHCDKVSSDRAEAENARLITWAAAG